MKKLLGSLCVAVVVAGGFIRMASTEGGRGGGAATAPDPLHGDEAPPRTPVRTADPVRPTPGPPSLEVEPPPGRERAPLEPIAGLLSGHEPGAAALLTWTPLLPELEGLPYIHSIDFDRLRAVTVSVSSDAGGRFRFPAVPESAASGDSAVWITRPGREASSVRLGPAEGGWRWPEVEPARARDTVRIVVRRGGEPVKGASVRHTLSFWGAGQTAAERRLRRVFLRDARTGPDGSATIVPGGGDNVLLASDGDERSLLWVGTPELGEDVELELLPTVEVSGRVVADDPALALAGVRYHVGYASAEDGSDLVFAGGSRGVRADRSFGPDPWPRGEASRLVVHVSGGEIVPAHVEVPNPPAGARAVVELTTTRGLPFDVAVADPAGEPVEGAEVRAQLWTGQEWLGLRQELTGEDGRARLIAPRGPLYVQVEKPGFTVLTFDDHRTLVPQAAGPLRAVLRPAGAIEGFVHHGSEPVKRFTLVGWNEDRSWSPQPTLEDEEGAFRLDGVPRGETLHLFAFSDRLPQSDTSVFVLGDEPRTVELELPLPRKARGRVVDSVTSAPLAAATIQHLTSGMTGLATYRGRAMKVQADGSFELDGFCAGRGGFACAAEGYETLFYHTREDGAEVIDVGLLVMNPLSVLDVRVREAGVSDFVGYHAWNRHSDDKTPLPLASDGTRTLPARAGPFEVNVTRPDGSLTWVSGLVGPGERLTVEVDLATGIELAVVLEEPPEGVESWSACAFSASRASERRTEGRWSREREAFVLRGLDGGDVVLELWNGGGELVAQRSLRLTDSPQQTVALALGGEERRVRLVDGRGRPWASCPVVVSLEDSSGWYALRETDGAGELALGPLDHGRIVLSAKLGSESIAYGVPVELEPDPARTTTVELDVGPRSLLLLTEEGRPLAGVSVAYRRDRAPRTLEFGYASEESGVVRGPFLGPGTYTVSVSHPGSWPTRHRVASRDAADPLPLELFSRATLAIEVTTLAGEPIPGATLALEHVELGQSAADWLEAGLISSGTGLSADPAGRLVLEGVPRGTYSWTCTSPSGASTSATAHLRPGEQLTLPIRIDER